MTHGTRYAYDKKQCRCEVCTAANAKRDRERYWRDPEKARADARARMKRHRWQLAQGERRSA